MCVCICVCVCLHMHVLVRAPEVTFWTSFIESVSKLIINSSGNLAVISIETYSQC